MSEEILLSALNDWCESNGLRTPTLTIVRRVVQGIFPNLPVSQVKDLGKDWELWEKWRNHLGYREFEIFCVCQVLGYKKYKNAHGLEFRTGYMLHAKHTDEFRQQVLENGWFTHEAEVYRSIYESEDRALQAYFGRFLEGKNPEWLEVKKEFILECPPLYVYFSWALPEVREIGEEATGLWISGKSRVLNKKLQVDRTEYLRACINALIHSSQTFDYAASNFTVIPDCEYSLAYQVAFQLKERKDGRK